MPLWSQNLVVILIVGGCAAYVGWQGFQALRGRKSRLGSCCAKGCAANAAKSDAPHAERVHFLPVEMLTRKR